MKVISDMDLMRYADGDLPASEAAIITSMLTHDTNLRRRLDVFTKTRGPVAAVFDEILEERVPSHLIACIRRAKPAAQPRHQHVRTPFDAVRNWISDFIPAPMSPAFAASIAVAVALAGSAGWLAAGRSGTPDALVVASAGGLVASGALAEALEHSPSTRAMASGGATVTPVMSFRSTSGAVCREYRVVSEAGPGADFAGLGCRGSDGVWRIALHAETPKVQTAGGDYQTAGGGSVEAIDAFVATIIAGDAFGPGDETALIGKGWQTPDRKPGGLSATP